MKPNLNNSPDLTMVEIISKLFNHNFLSDVQFLIEDKIIYAHSFILMMRSVVFQQQLNVTLTLGEPKLIPIDNVKYTSVFQFIQFIYTDQCDVTEDNALELFTLAKRYKVIKLENLVIGSIKGCNYSLNMFEHCLLENNELQTRFFEIAVLEQLEECLNTVQFLTLDATVIEKILRFDRMNVSEYQLFEALTRWIAYNSHKNQINDLHQRAHYQHLILLIRFPVMTVDEICKCTKNHQHLFTVSDCGLLFKIIAKSSDAENLPWNTMMRDTYKVKNVWVKFSKNKKFETKFSVSCQLILIGLRFGNEKKKMGAKIKFSSSPRDTESDITENYCVACAPYKLNTSLINLGESICLRPNTDYIIEIEYFSKAKQFEILCRKENVNLFTNIPSLINIETISRNLYDLFVKLPE